MQPCADRALQVPGDPYSPPCFTFSGDNGGSTYKGITGTDVVVAVRELEGPTAGEIFAQLSGTPVISSKEAVENTILALADYFNSHFEFYGRKIKIEFFKGQGSGASELLGGGKEQALADAVHVSQEMGAFADLSGITLPYADALVQQGILNFGAPYPSPRLVRRPRSLAWSNFPDGTNVTESAAAEILARQPAGSVAEYGGPGTQGKPHVYGIVAPENQEYQESVSHYETLLAAGGIVPKINLKYKLDINSMPNQASNIVAQLKDAGVTTVLCGCDPVMLALGLTPKANEQDYYPEWSTSGLAFVDQDIVSQLIDTKQWSRAYGIAYNAESEPQGRSYPYAAYKQERPNDEPAFGVEELYYGMYMLAIGLQMAGPDLTPQSFAQGMFAYPAASGPGGLWALRPRRLHDHRRLPRDLVGPQPHLRPEQQARGVGAAQRRPALHGGDRRTRTRSLLPGRMTMDLELDRARHTNGHRRPDGDGPNAPDASGSAASAIGRLRRRPRNIHLARGFGPLLVGTVLVLLMLWIAPSVAPEHIVERPVSTVSTTTSIPATTVAP